MANPMLIGFHTEVDAVSQCVLSQDGFISALVLGLSLLSLTTCLTVTHWLTMGLQTVYISQTISGGADIVILVVAIVVMSVLRFSERDSVTGLYRGLPDEVRGDSENTTNAKRFFVSWLRSFIQSKLPIIGIVLFFVLGAFFDILKVIAHASCLPTFRECGGETLNRYIVDLVFHPVRLIFMGAVMLFCVFFHGKVFFKTPVARYAIVLILVATLTVWFDTIVYDSRYIFNARPIITLEHCPKHMFQNKIDFECLYENNTLYLNIELATTFLFPLNVQFLLLVCEILLDLFFGMKTLDEFARLVSVRSSMDGFLVLPRRSLMSPAARPPADMLSHSLVDGARLSYRRSRVWDGYSVATPSQLPTLSLGLATDTATSAAAHPVPNHHCSSRENHNNASEMRTAANLEPTASMENAVLPSVHKAASNSSETDPGTRPDWRWRDPSEDDSLSFPENTEATISGSELAPPVAKNDAGSLGVPVNPDGDIYDDGAGSSDREPDMEDDPATLLHRLGALCSQIHQHNEDSGTVRGGLEQFKLSFHKVQSEILEIEKHLDRLAAKQEGELLEEDRGVGGGSHSDEVSRAASQESEEDLPSSAAGLCHRNLGPPDGEESDLLIPTGDEEVFQDDTPNTVPWLFLTMLLNLIFIALGLLTFSSDTIWVEVYLAFKIIYRTPLLLVCLAGFYMSRDMKSRMKKFSGLEVMMIFTTIGNTLYFFLTLIAIVACFRETVQWHAYGEDPRLSWAYLFLPIEEQMLWLLLFNGCINFVETFLQTTFLFHAWGLTCPVDRRGPSHAWYRLVVVYLTICNLTTWINDSFAEFRETDKLGPVQEYYYDQNLWNVIYHVTVPFTLFYRFTCFVIFLEIYLGS